MTLQNVVSLMESISDILPALIISGTGGIANYLYKVSKGDKFHFVRLLVNILLSARLGYVVQGRLDPTSKLYGPTLSITGFCAYPILNILEYKGSEIISKFTKW